MTFTVQLSRSTQTKTDLIFVKKHIYIAYTGGTIGMEPSAQGYIPKAGFLANTLAAMTELTHEEMPDYTLHEYQPLIDSSDMSPRHWQIIAEDIRQNYEKYDGFVVLHGTDTMAFTASALSFMFENLSKPVVVTGSQIPIAQLRSDGQTNLLNALYIAANYPIHEVGLFFNNKLLRGNRSKKVHSDGLAAFNSPNLPPLLEAGIKIKPIEGVVKDNINQKLLVADIKSQAIGVIMLYPGIQAEVIRNAVLQPVKALILISYGVGNAPNSKEFIQAIKHAIDNGTIVVNCTQCLKGGVDMQSYATGNTLKNLGVASAKNMTFEASLAKLHYLLSKELSSNTIKQMFEDNLRGEMD